ncbi:MAG: acyltransferase [Bradyrhizobiaceae bacterium]|nr:acyltransferase [Bradyrhizobiaceae bacterium]
MPSPDPALARSRLLHPHYYADIDGLRALAVLCVVACHAFPNQIRGGFIGVDILFVISGYLISTIVFRSLDKRSFSFAAFYYRRAKRIFPALIVVLAASYGVGVVVLLPGEFRQPGQPHGRRGGVCVQFLWLARGRTLRLILVCSVLVCSVAAVSFYLNVNEIGTDAVATFYFPQTHAGWIQPRQGNVVAHRRSRGGREDRLRHRRCAVVSVRCHKLQEILLAGLEEVRSRFGNRNEILCRIRRRAGKGDRRSDKGQDAGDEKIFL